jgi:hypothetical protein
MDLRQTLVTAHEALTKAQIEHALIGGFALATFGHHRATVDIDFLADGSDPIRVKAALEAVGFSVRFENAEVIQFTGPTGHLDILLARRPMSLQMLKNAKRHPELMILVACPEDVVGLKIQAYKNDPSREFQDKADILRLLSLPGIDLEKVKTYADLFSEWPTIKAMKGMS